MRSASASRSGSSRMSTLHSVSPDRVSRLPLLAVPSVNVSSPTGVPDDDAYWQRPEGGAEQHRPAPPAPRKERGTPYAGPPRAQPPPSNWRPPVVAEPPPPRALPSQDLGALAEDERSARTVTYGVGLVAGAIALILMCLLCARAIL